MQGQTQNATNSSVHKRATKVTKVNHSNFGKLLGNYRRCTVISMLNIITSIQDFFKSCAAFTSFESHINPVLSGI